MEIKTCEQYVLDKLEMAEVKISSLKSANRALNISTLQLERVLGAFGRQVTIENAPVAREVILLGMKTLMHEQFATRSTPVRDDRHKPISFDVWCLNAMFSTNVLNADRKLVIEFFEPELRAEYEQRLEHFE